MAGVGISGTVTREDQRSYIKNETLCGENPTDIYNAYFYVMLITVFFCKSCAENAQKSTGFA